MITLSAFDDIIQNLTQDQNLTRIRKLLVYGCHHIWESDPVRLQQYSLASLIKTLLQLAPTLDRLKAYLNDLVRTLNKRAEYTLVANAIVHHLKGLYPTAPAPSSTQNKQYQSIAQRLEQDPDAERIKKLLLCACTQTWETDAQRLAAICLAGLVQNLHELAPTADTLELVLSSVVGALNRQAHYDLIARRVLATLQPLYAGAIEETLTLSFAEAWDSAAPKPNPQPSSPDEDEATGLHFRDDAHPATPDRPPTPERP